MVYHIEPGTYNAAKRLGVIVKPSHNVDKKIDVFDKDNNKLASIGASGMKDYYKYLKYDGSGVAAERRRLYKQRHEKDRHVHGSPGFWASNLLW